MVFYAKANIIFSICFCSSVPPSINRHTHTATIEPHKRCNDVVDDDDNSNEVIATKKRCGITHMHRTCTKWNLFDIIYSIQSIWISVSSETYYGLNDSSWVGCLPNVAFAHSSPFSLPLLRPSTAFAVSSRWNRFAFVRSQWLRGKSFAICEYSAYLLPQYVCYYVCIRCWT